MAVLLLIASLFHTGCSHKFDYDARIVNGLPISADEYPWMVSLRREIATTSGWVWYSKSTCGASLIDLSPPVILTAAHCIDSYTYNSTDMTIRDSYNRINYLYADINRTYPAPHNVLNDTYYTIPILYDNIYIHPLYSGDLTYGYDIALLILSSYNESQSNLTSVYQSLLPSLLESNDYDDNTQCCKPNEELTVIGYGRIYDDGPSSNVLRTTSMQHLDKVNCTNVLVAFIMSLFNNSFPPNITSTEELIEEINDEFMGINDGTNICVVGNNTDVCNGDSGGPLFRMNKQDKAEIIGVASYIIGDCNDGLPTAYTNVASYYDWIMKVITFVVDGESYDPTMDPTQDPTLEPTTDPSQMPSESPIVANAAYSINLVHLYVFIVYFIYFMV